MSNLADRQARIIAALATIPAIAAVVDVTMSADGIFPVGIRPCIYPEDAFVLNLSKQPQLFVCAGDAVRTQAGTMNSHKQRGREHWYICSVSTSFASAVAAQTQTGGTFDLCEAVDDVQGVNIGVPGGKQEFLIWLGRKLTQAANRSPNGGGSVGYITEFEAPERFF